MGTASTAQLLNSLNFKLAGSTYSVLISDHIVSYAESATRQNSTKPFSLSAEFL